MHTQRHVLSGSNSGTERSLVSLHYGRPGSGPKVVLQTALHADELPGMVVLQHLRERLEALESSGKVLGEIVLIPMANPIGLDQQVMYAHLGRFELNTMENFNRYYPDLALMVGEQVGPLLTQDPDHNRDVIRAAMRERLAQAESATELDSLRHVLMGLACDADIALDLHCDFEAALHLYVEYPYLDQVDALSRYLGAKAVLWAEGFGTGLCYDEALSGVWWRLAARYPSHPIPLACLSSTVELRGQTDVGGASAVQDATALEHYLQHVGALAGKPPAMPAAVCEPTPLAGSQTLQAPHAGVVDYQAAVGSRVKAGDLIAWVIEPVQGIRSGVYAQVDGVLYARHILRWAYSGMDLGKIAGATAFKTGPLLSP